MSKKYDLEDLLQVVNVLNKKDDPKEDPKEDPKPKTEEEIRAEILAELKAEQSKSSADEDEDDKDDREEDGDDEDKADDERERRHITRSIKSGLKAADVDGDMVKSLLEFVNYDTLKGEEGEADDEKIESFVELVSGVARRVPPKAPRHGSAEDDGGLGKYLPNK